MSGGIYLMRGDDELVEMRETPYEAEDVLQQLIAKFPSLLAGDQFGGDTPRRFITQRASDVADEIERVTGQSVARDLS